MCEVLNTANPKNTERLGECKAKRAEARVNRRWNVKGDQRSHGGNAELHPAHADQMEFREKDWGLAILNCPDRVRVTTGLPGVRV